MNIGDSTLIIESATLGIITHKEIRTEDRSGFPIDPIEYLTVRISYKGFFMGINVPTIECRSPESYLASIRSERESGK